MFSIRFSAGMMTTLLCHRLFLAFRPPLALVAAIGRWRDVTGAGTAVVADDRLHMTALMLGNFQHTPTDLIARIADVLSRSMLCRCRIVLDMLVGGPGTTLLVPSEPLRGMEAVQARLAALVAHAGIAPAPWWRFSPHMTLHYDSGERGQQPIDPISWTATELVLIESLVGQSRHLTRGRWRLIDRQPIECTDAGKDDS